MEALDSDGPGLNSEVSYDKEGEDSNKFSVDKDTGIVTVAPGEILGGSYSCRRLLAAVLGCRGGTGS